MSKRERPSCGTYGGYQAHLRRKETPCQPCRDAAAEYQRNWRMNEAKRAVERQTTAARHRALTRLARAHPVEYRRLYAEESASAYIGAAS
jgi:hypothetical protein